MPERTSITREFLRSILDYDPETGVFTWRWRGGALPRWNSKHAGKAAGSPERRGYIAVRIGAGLHYAHRLAFIWMTGDCPILVDHIDQDKSNNRWVNLRAADRSGNATNSNYSSRGVHWCAQTKRWRAVITKSGRTRHPGRFDSRADALRAYDSAARELFGDFYCKPSES